MSTDATVKQLIINTLSQEQYSSLTSPSDTELYLTPDTTATDISDAIATHNTNNQAHADIRNLIADKMDSSLKGAVNGVAELDSNGKVPLSQINDALLGNVSYQGTWDASTGNPPTTTPTKGNYWITTTAGTYSSIYYEVGDWIICNADTPTVVWDIVKNTDAVRSVDGHTGDVIIVSDGTSSSTSYTWSIDKLKSEFALPDRTGQDNKFLKTTSSGLQWATVTASVSWGGITGTLSSQTDLQTALDAKQDTLEEYSAQDVDTLWSSI